MHNPPKKKTATNMRLDFVEATKLPQYVADMCVPVNKITFNDLIEGIFKKTK
jgi:hypothetical protein